MCCVLALDFDGVLHPATGAVFVDFSQPAWQLIVQLRTQGRFVWVPHLEQALRGSDAQILIHSTWRRRVPDVVLRQFLGEALASSVIVADHWIEPSLRRELSHAAYIAQVLQAYQDVRGVVVNRLCVVDDRPQLFREDAHLLQPWQPHFIWVDGEQGLSSAAARQALHGWAHQDVCLADDAEQAAPSR